MNEVDVAVIGAGAAGIGAARTLRMRGVSFEVLEASHRIGGRALTEEIAPGVALDLGCHWMHSASLNPLVAIADSYGFSYTRGSFARGMHLDGRRATEAEMCERNAFVQSCHERLERHAAAGEDRSVFDTTERHSPWTPMFDYWVSLNTSHDVDQVSLLDLVRYRDTGEDWPLKEGYGTLIARLGANVGARLNSRAETVRWGAEGVRVSTPKGDLRARAAIVTVSTGVLAAGDIRFVPDLPAWKHAAISALPLGNHNRICLTFGSGVLDPELPAGADCFGAGSEPMWFSLRPFGHDHVVGVTGGRFGWWLERAGVEAAADFARQCLAGMLGNDVARRCTGHKVSAWGGDPWVRGAYSGAMPGAFHQRAALARNVDERLYFAGEASSTTFFATAHGAYMTGIEAGNAVADDLGANR